jgi:hypothetical protein
MGESRVGRLRYWTRWFVAADPRMRYCGASNHALRGVYARREMALVDCTARGGSPRHESEDQTAHCRTFRMVSKSRHGRPRRAESTPYPHRSAMAVSDHSAWCSGGVRPLAR